MSVNAVYRFVLLQERFHVCTGFLPLKAAIIAKNNFDSRKRFQRLKKSVPSILRRGHVCNALNHQYCPFPAKFLTNKLPCLPSNLGVVSTYIVRVFFAFDIAIQKNHGNSLVKCLLNCLGDRQIIG